jgi:hypothetical protein
MVGLPVEMSVNLTVSGADPEVGVAVKSALMVPGVETVTYPVLVLVFDPPVWLLAVRVTV